MRWSNVDKSWRAFSSCKAEAEVVELTKQLEELEDELDSAESTLAEVNSKLYIAETTADESER